LENVNASAVLADKAYAYDTDELRTWLKCRSIKAVIPPKSNRKEKYSAIIGIIRSGMPSNVYLANLNTAAELPQDTRKKPLIIWGCCYFPRYFYG